MDHWTEPEKAVLAGYHEQFASNQNHHQSLIIQFFAAFVILLVGFGYATINQEDHVRQVLSRFPCTDRATILGNYNSFVSKDQYFALTLGIEGIFAGLFAYVCQVAYGFRRDLFIVRRIRYLVGGRAHAAFTPYGKAYTALNWPSDLFKVLMLILSIATVVLSFWTWHFIDVSYYMCGLFAIPLLIMGSTYWCFGNKAFDRQSEHPKWLDVVNERDEKL